jgi:hypothetical protein
MIGAAFKPPSRNRSLTREADRELKALSKTDKLPVSAVIFTTTV